MNRLGSWLLLTLCIVSLLAVPMVAQKTTGTLRGVVTDPSGAVLANVPVVVTHTETGQTRTVTTNTQGEYTADDLLVGTYSVVVKAPNFKESISTITVHASTTQSLNFQLQVGSTTEQVEVAASEVQVQTDSAQLAETVTGEQVRELPLNGRSFVQLTQLQPGVSQANDYDSKNKGLLSGVDFAVNGNSYTNNLFMVDGAPDNDTGSNRTILIYPSIEAISEFKMLRNSYGAEYGLASGAVINIVTKSGSNQWHGDALYFGRNTALNAYDYFASGAETDAKASGQTLPNNGKQIEQRNDFGFSVGGPIKKDKLFFFYSQEWNIERRGNVRQACVPTADERAGNFATANWHPNSNGVLVDQCNEQQPNLLQYGLATPANPLVMTSIDPAGVLLTQEYPLPNLTTNTAQGYNWVASPTSPIDWSQFNIRVDYNVSHSQTLMFRWTQDSWTNNSPNLYNNLWGDDPWPALESNWSQPSKQIMGRLTSTIGTSMVNDLEFSYSDNRINITPGGTDPSLLAATTAGIPPVWPLSFKTYPVGIPEIWGGLGNYGSYNNLWMIAPWHNQLDIYALRDDFSKVISTHTVRFGAYLSWSGKQEDTSANSNEYPTFGNGGWDTNMATGNDLANVLVPGAKWGISEPSTNLNNNIRWRDYEFYVADNWKVRRNLTLDIGLRYSYLTPTFNPNGAQTNFVPALYNPAMGSNGCNGVLVVPGTSYCTQANQLYGTNFAPGIPASNQYLINPKKNNFAPRVGLSWDPWGNGNNAIRAGFGMFYQRDRTSATGYALTNNVPFVLNASVNRTLDGPNPPGLPLGNAGPSSGVNTDAKLPYSLQWNLAVEHGFGKNTTIEVAYVGNHAVDQLNSYDMNYVQPQDWATVAFLSSGAQNPYRQYGAGNWGTLTEWIHNGSASYNSLQALFKTQIQKFQLQAAYTYSHSIGDVVLDDSSGGIGAQSYVYGPEPWLNRGNTHINRPQIFVANLVYNLPTLKGQNEFVQSTLGNWEVAAITQYASGTSTQFMQGGVSENTNQTVGGAGGQLSSLFGTGYANGQRPLVTGQSCTAGTGGAQVLNPGAVTLIGYQIGTIPSSVEPVGYCHGPGYVNTDFSVDKNWRVWGERVRIQFRMDFFNVFNHANFNGGDINTTLAANVNCGAANSAGKYNPCNATTNNVISSQTLTGNVGQVTAARAARELQYGLKVIF